MLGFRSFVSASATLEGIEVNTMMGKSQIMAGLCPLPQFAAFAA